MPENPRNSLTINLLEVSKRYRLEWIFKNISHEFQPGTRTAILGPNGSGKSTLMRILSGHLTPSRGRVSFVLNEKNAALDPDLVWKSISYAAPYIELIEEFTLIEAIEFQAKLKPFRDGLRPNDLINLLDERGTSTVFQKNKGKEIRFFSSGMKQRLRLALATCAATPILLLDEPTTNLDAQGIDWYRFLVEKMAAGRTIVIASNDPVDMDFCEKRVDILDFKG